MTWETVRAISGKRPSLARFGAALSTLVLTSAAPVPAFAERLEYRGTQEEREACTPDVFRLCSGYIPNEPAIVQCLIHYRAQLSPACARVFDDTATENRPRSRGRD